MELEGWEDQLENQLGINLRGEYGLALLARKSFDMYTTVEGSIGNIHIYARPMIHFRLGKFMPIQYSVARQNQLLGKRGQEEFFLDLGLGSKISAYDATVSGNIFKGNELFEQKDINNFIFNGYLGLSYFKDRWSAVIKYHLNTSALNSSGINKFAVLSFGYRF